MLVALPGICLSTGMPGKAFGHAATSQSVLHDSVIHNITHMCSEFIQLLDGEAFLV